MKEGQREKRATPFAIDSSSVFKMWFFQKTVHDKTEVGSTSGESLDYDESSSFSRQGTRRKRGRAAVHRGFARTHVPLNVAKRKRNGVCAGERRDFRSC